MLLSAIQKAKTGNLESFGILYDASYERVYRFLFYRLLDTSATEDTIAIVYMKALKWIRKFRGTTQWEFFSWILHIAYTTLIDYLRHESPIVSLDTIEWEPGYTHDTQQKIDHHAKLEEVLAYMDTFSERDRLIVTMRIWEELSYEEISIITGESVSNAKKIVSRSLAKITANISELSIITLVVSHVIIK